MESISGHDNPQYPDPEPEAEATTTVASEDSDTISLEDKLPQSGGDLSASMSMLRDDLRRKGIPETGTKPIDYVIAYRNYEGLIDTGGCCCCGRVSKDAALKAHQVDYLT